jgi:hypothetical protein
MSGLGYCRCIILRGASADILCFGLPKAIWLFSRVVMIIAHLFELKLHMYCI